MKRFLGVLFAAALTLGSAAAFGQVLEVDVTGGSVAGTESHGIVSFKGIPFAAPPVGELRWKAPQPVAPWSGVRKADVFAPQCMQTPYPAGSPYAMAPAAVSEDCLYLNVWTALAVGAKRPVMVWIHG